MCEAGDTLSTPLLAMEPEQQPDTDMPDTVKEAPDAESEVSPDSNPSPGPSPGPSPNPSPNASPNPSRTLRRSVLARADEPKP